MSKDRDVWGYMIESFITNISLAERAVEKDVVDMMKVNIFLKWLIILYTCTSSAGLFVSNKRQNSLTN